MARAYLSTLAAVARSPGKKIPLMPTTSALGEDTPRRYLLTARPVRPSLVEGYLGAWGDAR